MQCRLSNDMTRSRLVKAPASHSPVSLVYSILIIIIIIISSSSSINCLKKRSLTNAIKSVTVDKCHHLLTYL